MHLPLILASSSKSRLKLLHQISITPDYIIPHTIQETALPKENIKDIIQRLAYEKALDVTRSVGQGIIIGAHTVTVIGRSIVKQPKTTEDIKKTLELLSNRRHRVYTSVSIIKKDRSGYKTISKLVKSIIKLKFLSKTEINYYCELHEGINKKDGYIIKNIISGYGESYISFLSGSFSNIAGLPLCETTHLLNSIGYTMY